MMAFRRISSLTALGCLAVFACTSEDPGGVTLDPIDAGTADTFHAGDVGDLSDAVAESGPCDANPICSSDLQHVVDCRNNVLRSCPADKGCDPATLECVPACDTALSTKGSIGCDFYSMEPTDSFMGGYCFAAYIVNTWFSPVTIQVEYGGAPVDLTDVARIPSGSGAGLTYAPLPGGKLPPGQVAVLFLMGELDPWRQACPEGVVPPYAGPDGPDGTGLSKAFHITTDRPVAAYDILPYGGGDSAVTSATLLLPTNVWDKNYVAVDTYEVPLDGFMPGLSTQLVAREDNTSITIVPTHDIPAGPSVAAAGAGVATTYTLNKGQVLQFGTRAGLNGSAIEADKPIGMWAAAPCLFIDPDNPYCDSAHQQIPPVPALGSEYVAVRYRNRVELGEEEAPPWRIMALVDGTKLTYDPAPPAGAPTSLNAGELVKFYAEGPFVVKSQDDAHPFYVAAHMTGCDAIMDNPEGCLGDPEHVNVMPAKQLLSSYTFFTDPTYPETNLVLVRAKSSDGTFKDVTLDCAGVIPGWKPVGKGGDYQYARIDLVRHNFEPQVYAGGTCDNGVHRIHSDGRFGLTVWGWGSNATWNTDAGVYFNSQAVSYAFPAGTGLRPLNTVTVPAVPK